MEGGVRSAVDRFWERLYRSECWEWTGNRSEKGYGLLVVDGVRWKAHRFAWTQARGAIPAGMLVCHRCDNPPCCNPAHLFLGTNEDNIRDCVTKGRHAWSKLTPEIVQTIRQAAREGYALRTMARELGIDRNTVRQIARRELWRHVA